MTATTLATDALVLQQELKSLALAALDRLLLGASAPPTPELSKTFWAILATEADLPWANRLAGQRSRRRFMLSEPQPWTAYQVRQLPVKRLLPRSMLWVSRSLDHLRRLPQSGPPEAAIVIGAVAASAWADADFTAETARRLRRTLRNEVLMAPGPQLELSLSPVFWWVLIAAFARSGALGSRLRVKALALAEREGWAGFWEQYLLLRGLRDGLSLAEPLTHLPLLAADAFPAEIDEGEGDMPALRKGWRQEAPLWAESLVAQTI